MLTYLVRFRTPEQWSYASGQIATRHIQFMFLNASQGAGALVAAGTRVFEWLLSAYLAESALLLPLVLHVRRLTHLHWEGSRICPIWENSRPKSPLLLDFHSIGSFFKRKVDRDGLSRWQCESLPSLSADDVTTSCREMRMTLWTILLPLPSPTERTRRERTLWKTLRSLRAAFP